MKDKVQGMSQRDSQYPKDSPFCKEKKAKKSKNPSNSSGKDRYESIEETSDALTYTQNPQLKSSILKKINEPSSPLDSSDSDLPKHIKE